MIQSRYRFSRASRLLKPTEFQAVFDARKACRGQWLTVHRTGSWQPTSVMALTTQVAAERTTLVNHGQQSHRLGMIVAKRLVPTASRRNLIRRVLREFFRNTRHALPPGDLIIRLHASPFPSPAQLRKGVPLPTRQTVVSGLRTDLAQILKRVEQQIHKEGASHGA